MRAAFEQEPGHVAVAHVRCGTEGALPIAPAPVHERVDECWFLVEQLLHHLQVHVCVDDEILYEQPVDLRLLPARIEARSRVVAREQRFGGGGDGLPAVAALGAGSAAEHFRCRERAARGERGRERAAVDGVWHRMVPSVATVNAVRIPHRRQVRGAKSGSVQLLSTIAEFVVEESFCQASRRYFPECPRFRPTRMV